MNSPRVSFARVGRPGFWSSAITALVLFNGLSSAGVHPDLELVETAPVETYLDHPDIPEAFEVWEKMINSAERSIALAEFYASNESGSRLEPIIKALEAAAQRGVSIRLLAEKKFYDTYPKTLDRLSQVPGIEMRLYDVASLMGGVLHAKYFIVDEVEAYLGSQNFDWRALTHIQELGVRIREPLVARALQELFDLDWQLAIGEIDSIDPSGRAGRLPFPVAIPTDEETLRVTPVFSPRGWLPDASAWDLTHLIEMIASADSTIRLQLLTYRTIGRDGEMFAPLETALRAAAARGVSVQILLSDWCKRPGTIEGLQSLQVLSNIEIRLVTIPPWSGGFIPYARVVHAKYLISDEKICWIGTSNWEKDYFYASRNVGLLIEGHGPTARLSQFFRDTWDGPYAEVIDPCRVYTPPRIGE